MPGYANIVNISKVLLETVSLFRFIFTPLLRACMPGYTNIVNLSKVPLDVLSLLRLIFTTLLWACMPCYANIVNICKVLLEMAPPLHLIITSFLRACIPYCAIRFTRLAKKQIMLYWEIDIRRKFVDMRPQLFAGHRSKHQLAFVYKSDPKSFPLSSLFRFWLLF